MMRKVFGSFKASLEEYIDFLLMFEETPRSKLAKKYLPPMDVLEEETPSMMNDSVRTSTMMMEGKLRLTTKQGLAAVSREHSINSHHQFTKEEDFDLGKDDTPRLGSGKRLNEMKVPLYPASSSTSMGAIIKEL